jgi:protein-S-isoprenylcysteine O-methyltransferase Ste14
LQYYVLNLLVLRVAIGFYYTAGEYGYVTGQEYYQGWFRMLEWAWLAWLWGGLPYVLVTRAFKHDTSADARDPGQLLLHLLRVALARLQSRPDALTTEDFKAARSLLVKLFFAPLMTAFFLQHFPHLVSNIRYLLDVVPELIRSGAYTHAQLNTDLFNVGVSFCFSIDVALAWCGYMVSSRWVDNLTISAEPTVLGWLVCILCYPPFHQYLGLYYAAPAERAVLDLEHPWMITLATCGMLISYLVYVLATLWFGVRFSNLTHRGILRTGPYAWVRHPAYAAKNFAWWCIMLPVVLVSSSQQQWLLALSQALGLVCLSGIYYLRAVTEERHLRQDLAYRQYCEQVRWRFVPGVV